MPNYTVFNPRPDNLKALIYGSDGTDSLVLNTDSSGKLNLATVDTISAIAAGTLTSVGTVGTISTLVTGTLAAVESATIAGGTLSAVEGATITAGTLSSVGTVDTISALVTGTLAAVESATIAGGTLSAVEGATITAGTLSSVGMVDTISALVTGTLAAVESATIAGGTLSAILSATISGGTITTISQANFTQFSTTGLNFTNTSFTPIDANTITRETNLYKTYSYFIVNQTGSSVVDLQVEISSDGTNWYVDQSTSSLAAGSVEVLVPIKFLKYTRLSYQTAGNSTIDVYLDAQV